MSDPPRKRVYVVVDVTDLNHQWLRDYPRKHPNARGVMAQAVKRIGEALNRQETK